MKFGDFEFLCLDSKSKFIGLVKLGFMKFGDFEFFV